MTNLQVCSTAYQVNQMFWGNLRKGESVEGVTEITYEFAKTSIYEVICRRLLTDANIQITGNNGVIMPMCQLLQMARTYPLATRQNLYKKFTQKEFLKRLLNELPSPVRTEDKVCSVGWEFSSPKFKNQAEFTRILKVCLRMAFLVDPLSVAVVAAMQCTGSGNEIDLPWNACNVVKALNETEYEITSIPNWMYAQGIPYVDNALLHAQRVQLSLTPDKQLFVLRENGYVRIPFAQFKPAFEQGLLDVDLDNPTLLSLGWEVKSFYG